MGRSGVPGGAEEAGLVGVGHISNQDSNCAIETWAEYAAVNQPWGKCKLLKQVWLQLESFQSMWTQMTYLYGLQDLVSPAARQDERVDPIAP
jgi:hypothetical protein